MPNKHEVLSLNPTTPSPPKKRFKKKKFQIPTPKFRDTCAAMWGCVVSFASKHYWKELEKQK
jgi:hypothetical protein